MVDLIIAALLAILPPCGAEDAAGPCYWDAAVQGNGQGTSFVALPGDAS